MSDNDRYQGNPDKVDIIHDFGLLELGPKFRLRFLLARSKKGRGRYFYNLEKFVKDQDDPHNWLIYQAITFEVGDVAQIFLWLFKALRPLFGLSLQDTLDALGVGR